MKASTLLSKCARELIASVCSVATDDVSFLCWQSDLTASSVMSTLYQVTINLVLFD